ncbi:MAG TPA: aminoglycoside phosphotransferase family protein [Caulobacteraceae bacterium]|jgi:aminoglycoside phosphotransferase (APT) family kinase protein|nr:aminoglycoside phosphotransferase family protein [Caulobacteraceae bacterium]
MALEPADDAPAHTPVPAPGRGTPPAEIAVDPALARTLLRAQHPDLAHLPIAPVAEGWDNAVFRLGDTLALRLPRRAIGARLILNEQRWLPSIAPLLPIETPLPVRAGAPQQGYPWPWSVVRWVDGRTAEHAPLRADQGPALSAVFRALHVAAPAEAPHNPWRGVPLAGRSEAFETRWNGLAARGAEPERRLREIWRTALAAADDHAATWIHGDPHPRNVLTRAGRLAGLIDWGDMAQGDRASDLAGIWLLLDARTAREAAIAALPEVSAATWARARGWAALYVTMFLEAGLTDDPGFAVVASKVQTRLLNGP